MKLISYCARGESRVGILDGDSIHPAAAATDMLALIESGAPAVPAGHSMPLSDARVLPPLRPGKILAIGRNYAEHARELKNAVPSEPLVFAVMPSAVIGHGDSIEWETELTAQVDWEGELAVVIGTGVRNVSAAQALDYVFGYTIANDVSARDLQSRDKQWTRAKGMDTFCPLGPCVVTRDEIPDPHNLRVITTVDGAVKQDGSTADMIYSIPALIEYLSRAFTLNPGDIILTGTPAGVGKAQTPPEFLRDGSAVSVEIPGIGKLTNTCREL